jgi:ABC-type transport system involved in cytochrome bd biosynthesis fused ATPase/permease subunit
MRGRTIIVATHQHWGDSSASQIIALAGSKPAKTGTRQARMPALVAGP